MLKERMPLGRTPIKMTPPRIDETPKEFARCLMTTKPPNEWPYLKDEADRKGQTDYA